MAVQLALIDVVPDVIPHATPGIPAKNAKPNDEAIEARGTLQEGLVDTGGVEKTEEPV